MLRSMGSRAWGAFRRWARRRTNQQRINDYRSSALMSRGHVVPVLAHPDGGSYFDPCVRRCGESLSMYVSDRSTGAIVSCASEDGIDWSEPRTALEPSAAMEGWADVVNRAVVVEWRGATLMYFTGQSRGASAIGVARRTQAGDFVALAAPVLQPMRVYEGVSVMNPCVVASADGTFLQMWYSAGENYEPDVICRAISEDGVTWVRSPEAPVLKATGGVGVDGFKVGGCDVVLLSNGTFAMFYIGYQNLDVARLCLAFSADGVRWDRSPLNPLWGPDGYSWDGHAVYRASALIEDGVIRLWYNGRRARVESVGLLIGESSVLASGGTVE